MEENKKCCDNKGCEKCPEYSSMGNCCCTWLKCPMLRIFIMAVVLLVVFCLGIQLGELRSDARGPRNYRAHMMNWSYKNVTPLTGNELSNTPATPEVPITQ